MSKEVMKKVSVEVSVEVWKKMKILSIQRDIPLAQVAAEILEKYVDKEMNLD